jgi:pyridoxamine 5'-phosphate oxidase-like protein
MSGAALTDRLAGLLRAGAPAILISVGADGWAHAAMTWAVAAGRNPVCRGAVGGVRFVVDHGSTTQGNLARNSKAALQVIGRDDVVALIKGDARERRARIEAATFPMAMWEMTVADVKDQAWGPVVVAPLAYDWRGPDADVLRRMEQAVLAELREWPGD